MGDTTLGRTREARDELKTDAFLCPLKLCKKDGNEIDPRATTRKDDASLLVFSLLLEEVQAHLLHMRLHQIHC